MLADNKNVALLKGTSLNQNRRNRTATNIKLCFDHSTARSTVGVGFQLKKLRLKANRLKQLIKASAVDGRHFNILHFARHFLDDHFVLKQISPNFVSVCSRAVDLVDRHNHRNIGGFRVVNRLDRLRHNRVIRSDHQDNDICYLRTTCTH